MKPKKTKLSLPQQNLLKQIAENPGIGGWPEYPPRVKLANLGFITFQRTAYGSSSFITAAGREWLEANEENHS